MADSKLTALTAAAAFDDADLLYVVQAGVSYKVTWASIKAAIATAVEYPEVANYAALPAAASHSGEIYVVLASQGTGWLFTLKESGFYRSDGADWTRLGALPADYFTDSVLYVSDNTDPTKVCKFELSGITSGNTRTLTIPDSDGTISLDGHTHAWADITGKPATFAPIIGAGAGDAVAGNDSRLTNARTPTTHATTHTDGTDDIQNATAAQKGLATAAQITKLDDIDAKASAKKVIGITIDGGGSAITTGVKSYLRVPWACTISKATVLADVTGSIVIDVWKDTYANFPPTVADTITASAKPTLSSAQKAEDATLTGWTTSVAAGDVLGFKVDSAATVTRVVLELEVTLT